VFCGEGIVFAACDTVWRIEMSQSDGTGQSKSKWRAASTMPLRYLLLSRIHPTLSHSACDSSRLFGAALVPAWSNDRCNLHPSCRAGKLPLQRFLERFRESSPITRHCRISVNIDGKGNHDREGRPRLVLPESVATTEPIHTCASIHRTSCNALQLFASQDKMILSKSRHQMLVTASGRIHVGPSFPIVPPS
jgi:hypothetical protein